MDPDFDFECPDCSATVQATVSDVAHERTVHCRNGHALQLKDEGGGARSTEKALRDLDKAIRKFGR